MKFFSLASKILLLLVGMETFALAGPTILETIPEDPSPDSRFVFYLHGKIIEDKGREAEHPRFGKYEYDAILEALAARGYVVISEQRKPKTNVGAYGRKVMEQIGVLLGKGVPPEQISVVGFSKGGMIALSVSARLKAPIRYVLLAHCPRRGVTVKAQGQVLAIREASDLSVTSCVPLFERSPRLQAHNELELEIGGGHGAFFKPQEAWLEPTFEWIEK